MRPAWFLLVLLSASTPAFGQNGLEILSQSAKSAGRGGASTAMADDALSATRNPALLTQIGGTRLDGTLIFRNERIRRRNLTDDVLDVVLAGCLDERLGRDELVAAGHPGSPVRRTTDIGPRWVLGFRSVSRGFPVVGFVGNDSSVWCHLIVAVVAHLAVLQSGRIVVFGFQDRFSANITADVFASMVVCTVGGMATVTIEGR